MCRSMERRAQLFPDAFGLIVHDDGGQSVQAVLDAVLGAARSLPSSTPLPRLDWHRRQRACSRRGPILHTRTGRGLRSRLQPRSRILLSTSTSSSTVGWYHRCALPPARPHPCSALARHATAPITRDTRTASLHTRPAAVFTAPPSSATFRFCVHRSASCSRRQATRASRRASGFTGSATASAGGVAATMSCGSSVRDTVSSRVHGCVLRISALVVTRVSCTACLVLRLWRTVSICLLAKRRKRLSNPTRRAFHSARPLLEAPGSGTNASKGSKG